MTTRRTHLEEISRPTNHSAKCVFALLAVVFGACHGRADASPARASATLDRPHPVVTDWSVAAYDAFVAGEKYANPMRAARVLAMLHLAQHDALAAIRPSYAPYVLTERAPGADPVAAAASAGFEILAAELPSQRPELARRLASSLAGVADRRARETGVALGKRAAAAVLERRRDDGGNTTVVVRPERIDGRPGVYRPVPPLDFVAAPGWVKVRPFALQSAKQFRVGAPPALDSDAYAAAFEEVKIMGRKGSAARTPEQTAYAKFWYEFSDIGWNRIARVVSQDRKLGLQDTARLFALLNMALSDSYVAGWDSKLHHDLWRPYTAIREADRDGNAKTAADVRWEPEEVTPPIHDYPSTHSALGNAGAAVLAHVFGDATPFAMGSTTASPAGATRRFASFSQAADENADSRVRAGLHFRFSCEAGQALGRQVGAWVVSTALRPQGSLASAR